MIDVSVSACHVGDCRELLAQLPDGCVQTCVTSPPYWGLRDYGCEGQLGLEQSPHEYVAQMVAVFRGVRRALRDDGTLWLNLGDSYASGGMSNPSGKSTLGGGKNLGAGGYTIARAIPDGLKPKDLVGIPWSVALALREPYYTGSIRLESERIWLAAMLDAEGCIFIHKRKAGQSNGQGYVRQSDSYGPGIEICNTSSAVVERIMSIVGKGSICSQGPDENGRRKQRLYRWNLRTTEARDFVRELYPYLVAKQHQARLLYGCPSSGERAEAAHAALIGLHRGSSTDVDLATPPSMTEPGFYLRSDIIWSKLNPMPESVTDRPTKSHEYMFLLSKSERYFYDADAIREAAVCTPRPETSRNDGGALGDNIRTTGRGQGHKGGSLGFNQPELGRNKRDVWTIASQPFDGAHFATMPPDLVKPCVLAGSRTGDLVLDPFFGSGTVGMVAETLGRRWVGFELNPEYAKISAGRTAQRGLAL